MGEGAGRVGVVDSELLDIVQGYLMPWSIHQNLGTLMTVCQLLT